MDDFNRFKACSFDCYGTLIDWETGIIDALGPWSERWSTGLSPEELLALFARHESSVQRIDPSAPYPLVLAATLGEMAGELGVNAAEQERLDFAASIRQWPAFPDSGPALARLARHFKLIVLSNVDRKSFEASRRRLGTTFDLVLTAEDTGAYKPDPRNFRRLIDAVAAMAIEPVALLHVAQSLFHDIEPASDAGLATVWINRRHKADGYGATPAPHRRDLTPSWVFTSLADFAEAAAAGRVASAGATGAR